MQNYVTRKDIIKAFENNEFRTYIQPKYNIYTMEVIGGEALVRWFHGRKGIIRPDEFIPVIERMGLIYKLDLFILEEVCKIFSSCKKQGPRIIPISVNLSRRTLNDIKIITRLIGILDKYEVPRELIELEITETVMSLNNEVIKKLKLEGFKLLMDDFGKGYSSFLNLKKTPVDVIKIDKEFLTDIDDSENARAILKTIVDLIYLINKEVVIEGIETEQQLDFIKSIKCKYAQGFLFSRAMDLKDFKQFIL